MLIAASTRAQKAAFAAKRLCQVADAIRSSQTPLDVVNARACRNPGSLSETSASAGRAATLPVAVPCTIWKVSCPRLQVRRAVSKRLETSRLEWERRHRQRSGPAQTGKRPKVQAMCGLPPQCRFGSFPWPRSALAPLHGGQAPVTADQLRQTVERRSEPGPAWPSGSVRLVQPAKDVLRLNRREHAWTELESQSSSRH
jgi:hypothetical protein